MSAQELVQHIEQFGFQLRADPANRRVLFRPSNLMPAELRDELSRRKDDVLVYLQSRGPVDVLLDPLPENVRLDLRDTFEERAAACEHEGNLPRETAEGIAWAELAEELARRLARTIRRAAAAENVLRARGEAA